MLFNYRYISHNIETFQSWLDHLVKQVWCRNSGSYTIDLLHPDLKAVVEEIGNDDSIKTDHLDGPIKKIDVLFQKLPPAQRAQFSMWYDNNNDIKALCANDPTKPPITYDDIKVIDNDLAEALQGFYTSLFKQVIKLSAVTRRLKSTIDEHYKDFVKVNEHDICPYCGIYRLDGEYDSTRDAYDHFLPKGTYPFNSVNFRNLAPMCSKCNSGYKLQKDPVRHIDPLHKAKTRTRRKAFYSYDTTASGISIELSLSTSNIDNLCSSDISVSVIAPGRDEEVEAWKDIFGIELRYKAHICGKNVGYYWLVQALNECVNVGKTPNAILEDIEQNFKEYPWAEANFLKFPFLRACQIAGLF